MNGLVEQRLVIAQPVAALPLPVPWRDPHTVPKERLAAYIADLEAAVKASPQSADLWTCLGMANAMALRVHRSMDALETARDLSPTHFWAQFKYAELNYRLRALPLAEQETLRALELASNNVEYGVSRRQLQEIRKLIREGTQKPAWVKPLPGAALASFAGIAALLWIGALLR